MQPRDFADGQALLRRALEPRADSDQAKATDCRDCGATFYQWKGQHRPYCASCGAERQRRQQLDAKESARARWLERMRAELDALEAD